jgi:hypothetical protein
MLTATADLTDRIREGLASCSAECKNKNSITIADLLSDLSSKVGESVTVEDVKDVFYDIHSLGDWDSFMKDDPGWTLLNRIERENEIIDRTSKLAGKPVEQMDAKEMQQTAFKLFVMHKEKYKEALKLAGVKLNGERYEEHYHEADSLFLFGLLERKHGIRTDKNDLVQRIHNTDFNLGYFNNIFKLRLRHHFEDLEKDDKTLRTVWETLHRVYEVEESSLGAYTVVNNELTAVHKIQPPELLEGKTLYLDIKPLAIAFGDIGVEVLVVLGQKYYKKGKEADEDLTLAIYNIQRGKKLASRRTGIKAAFSGTAIGASSFLGNVSVGSNGVIYAGGNNQVKRFRSNLDELTGNEDGFQDALELLIDKGVIPHREHYGSRTGIFEVVEDEGVHYFTKRDIDSHFGNVLAASDGKKIIGRLFSFSPLPGGCTGGGDDDNARLVAHGNEVYIKAEGYILAVDKSLTQKAYDNAFEMINDTEVSDFIPSNHCVDREGLVWAATKIEREPTSSIKAYQRGKEKGEIVTHFHPENHPGGWPAMRSMAISKNGILAYTDRDKDRIHFYQIKK